MTTISGAKNWITNPSFETNLTGYAYTGISASQNDAEDWAGDYSNRLQVTAVAADPAMYIDTAYRSTVVVGDDMYLAVRIKGPSSKRAYLKLITYTSGAVQNAANVGADFVMTGAWQTIRMSAAAITSDASVSCQLFFDKDGANNIIIGDVIYTDGWQLQRNQPIDTYIDGDQGSIYHWSGTAHASTSYRDDVTASQSIGTGGLIRMSPRLYRSNRNGDRLEEISEDLIEGTVSFNAENEIPMTFSARIRDISELKAYVDYVIPVQRLQYAGGSVVEEQVGHYVVVPSVRRYSATSTEGDIDARGIEWLLTIDEYTYGYTVKAGGDFCMEVRKILRDSNLPNFNIPDSDKNVPRKRTWEPGTKRLQIVNDLLDAAGFYPLFSNRDGLLTSFKKPNVNRADPAVLYDTGTRSDIVGVVTETPDMEGFANRLVLVYEEDSGNSKRVVERNDNEASPVSIPRLGFTKTITHTSNNINNATDARALAKRLLERAQRHLIKYEIETIPDPTRSPYEVYALRIQQDTDDYIAFGNYECIAWTLGFTPQQGSMKHTVQRLEVYE